MLVLNGANLGRLGTREPEIYGSTSFAELAALCEAAGSELGLAVDVRQTDHEGTLLEWLHEAADTRTPVVLNPAGWSHTSVVLADACALLTGGPGRGAHQQRVPARGVPPPQLRLGRTRPG